MSNRNDMSGDKSADEIWMELVSCVKGTGLTERDLIHVTGSTLRQLAASAGFDDQSIEKIENQRRMYLGTLLNEMHSNLEYRSPMRSPMRSPVGRSPSRSCSPMGILTGSDRESLNSAAINNFDTSFAKRNKPYFSTRRPLGDRSRLAQGMTPCTETPTKPDRRRSLSPVGRYGPPGYLSSPGGFRMQKQRSCSPGVPNTFDRCWPDKNSNSPEYRPYRRAPSGSPVRPSLKSSIGADFGNPRGELLKTSKGRAKSPSSYHSVFSQSKLVVPSSNPFSCGKRMTYTHPAKMCGGVALN